MTPGLTSVQQSGRLTCANNHCMVLSTVHLPCRISGNLLPACCKCRAQWFFNRYTPSDLVCRVLFLTVQRYAPNAVQKLFVLIRNLHRSLGHHWFPRAGTAEGWWRQQLTLRLVNLPVFLLKGISQSLLFSGWQVRDTWRDTENWKHLIYTADSCH